MQLNSTHHTLSIFSDHRADYWLTVLALRNKNRIIFISGYIRIEGDVPV